MKVWKKPLTVVVHSFPLDAVPVGIVLQPQYPIDAVGPGSGFRELGCWCVGNDGNGAARGRARASATGGHLVRVFRLLRRLIPNNPEKERKKAWWVSNGPNETLPAKPSYR